MRLPLSKASLSSTRNAPNDGGVLDRRIRHLGPLRGNRALWADPGTRDAGTTIMFPWKDGFHWGVERNAPASATRDPAEEISGTPFPLTVRFAAMANPPNFDDVVGG